MRSRCACLMHGNEILVFLLSLATLLGVARLLGEIARSFGLPQVVGELATGIFLGQTGLGRVWPHAYAFVFPSGAPQTMLSGYTTVAVVLLLVVAGLEVDLGIVKRRGRTALSVATLGILLPLAGGFIIGQFVPDHVIGSPDRRLLFSIFMGVALSISALPVIAKTLLDLGLFKTDVGLLVMTSAMVDDLVGWTSFSVLLGPMQGSGLHFDELAKTIGLAVSFAAFMLIVGRPLADRIIARLEVSVDLASGRVISLVIVLALIGAATTQWIGIHAVLGGLIVGVTVGDSPRLRERTRNTIHQFVTNIFAPVFFANLGLRIDFLEAFDPGLCLAVFLVATLAKLLGCGIGARISGLRWRESLAVAFGLNARGAMEIILAVLAEAKLIGDEVFVALVTMAIGTSLLAGPMMKRLLYPGRKKGDDGLADDAATLVREGGFVPRSTPRHRRTRSTSWATRFASGDLVEPALIPCSNASSWHRPASATRWRSRTRRCQASSAPSSRSASRNAASISMRRTGGARRSSSSSCSHPRPTSARSTCSPRSPAPSSTSPRATHSWPRNRATTRCAASTSTAGESQGSRRACASRA
ncbi:MAG: cation:proton antiporter [Labilithrix sp.]